MTAFPHPEQFPEQEQSNLSQSGTSNMLQFPIRINQGEQEQASAEYYLSLGNGHYNSFLTRSGKQSLELAINCYRKALENNPSLAEGYVKLASALFEKGEMPIETAIQYCQTAIAINPGLGEADLYLGYFLAKSGQLDAAANAFQHAIRKAPLAAPRPRMAFGKILLHKAFAKTEGADRKPKKQAVKAPTLTRRSQWLMQGVSQIGLGILQLPKDQHAYEVTKNAFMADTQVYGLLSLAKAGQQLGLSAASQWLLHVGCKKLPQESVFFHTLGDFAKRQKSYSEAIYYYQRAQELEPENPVILKKLASLYQDFNDGEMAVKCYETVLKASPSDTETMYQLAKLLSDRREYLRSLYYFKEIVKREQHNPYVYSNMGYALFKLEDYDGAIQEYKKAVTLGDDPEWTATVAQTLGMIYQQVKHNAQAALEMYQLAYELDPQNLDCITQLADLYIEQGHYESAIGAYRYLLTFEPENADCHSTIGYLLWQLDKNDEAIESYRKAISLKPENPIAFNNLGVIYLDEFCLPEKALEMFKEAFKQNPDYTLACFNQGRAMEALGETTTAARIYSHALAMNQDFAELDEEDITGRIDRLFSV